MDKILEYAKSILLFLFFFRILLLLLPEKSYEKYARPACMVFLLVLVVKPALSGGAGLEALLEQACAGVLAETKKQEVLFLQKGNGEADGFTEAVFSEYKKNLEEGIRARAEEAGYTAGEVTFEISAEADSFGEILFLHVTLKPFATEKKGKIEKIRILTATSEQGEGLRTKSAEELYLAEIFATWLGIGKNQVDVSILS